MQQDVRSVRLFIQPCQQEFRCEVPWPASRASCRAFDQGQAGDTLIDSLALGQQQIDSHSLKLGGFLERGLGFIAKARRVRVMTAVTRLAKASELTCVGFC